MCAQKLNKGNRKPKQQVKKRPRVLVIHNFLLRWVNFMKILSKLNGGGAFTHLLSLMPFVWIKELYEQKVNENKKTTRFSSHNVTLLGNCLPDTIFPQKV